MHRLPYSAFTALVLLFGHVESATAGSITSFGNVTALTDVSQLNGVLGTATFDGPTGQLIPLSLYSGNGMTLQGGHGVTIVDILSGATTGTIGQVQLPFFADSALYQPHNPFNVPNPPAGGALADSHFLASAAVATFDIPVTQFGLTAGNANQDFFYLTAWDAQGSIIGEVQWKGIGESAFVGIDTGGVPIAMISYGNHALFGGGSFSSGGSTTFSDTWIWAAGETPAVVPEPSSLALLGVGAASLASFRRWRRRVVAYMS